MFKLAKSLSPETLFFVNDYGIILDKYFEMMTIHGQDNILDVDDALV